MDMFVSVLYLKSEMEWNTSELVRFVAECETETEESAEGLSHHSSCHQTQEVSQGGDGGEHESIVDKS